MIGMMDTGMKIMAVISIAAVISLIVVANRWLKRR